VLARKLFEALQEWGKNAKNKKQTNKQTNKKTEQDQYSPKQTKQASSSKCLVLIMALLHVICCQIDAFL